MNTIEHASSADAKKLKWMTALVLHCIAYGALIPVSVWGIILGQESLDAAPVEVFIPVGLFPLLLYMISVGVAAILHYNCWERVSVDLRPISSAKLTGYMFIPFFNLYWAFTTWPKLVDGINQSGYRLPSGTKGLAYLLASAFLLDWGVFIFIEFEALEVPFYGELSLLVSTVWLVSGIHLYKRIVIAINYPS